MNYAATASMAPEYITRQELCRRLNISPSTVYRHDLRDFALLIGNAVRYDWRAIVEAYRMEPETEGDK